MARVHGFLRAHFQAVVLTAAGLIGLVLRTRLFYFVSRDFIVCQEPWTRKLRDYGGFEGLAHFTEFADYTPPYMYVLAFIAEFNRHVLYGLKQFSVFFDLTLAALVFLVMRRLTSRDSKLPACAAAVVFLSPTVVVNSSYWGQCDAVHTTCILASLLALLHGRHQLAVVACGLGLAFKLQTVFAVLPFMTLVFARQLPLRYALWLPVPYVVLALPALLYGAPFKDVMLVYLKQAGEYPRYTMNAPSLFAFMPGLEWNELVSKAATLFAGAVCVAISAAIAVKKIQLTPRRLVLLFFLSSILVPFLLPKMHERYFYMADALSIVVAFTHRRLWFVPLLVISSSLACYQPFLEGKTWVPLPLAAAMMAAALVATLLHVWAEFRETSQVDPASPQA